MVKCTVTALKELVKGSCVEIIIIRGNIVSNEDAWDEGMLYLEDLGSTGGYCPLCGYIRNEDSIADECTGLCEESKSNSFIEELKF